MGNFFHASSAKVHTQLYVFVMLAGLENLREAAGLIAARDNDISKFD